MAKKQARSQVPRDYDVYRLSFTQTVGSVVVVALAAAVFSYVFYKNVYIALAAMLLGLLGPRIYKRQLIDKRHTELNVQFKDLLYALNSSMSAGKTLEEALHSAQSDMRILYTDESAVILAELDNMVSKLGVNMAATDLLEDLGRRSGNEDIQSFANVLSSGLDKGIDQVNLIQKTVGVLTEKMEIKQEIATNVAAIKLEQNIMLLMPVALMLMIHLMAPDYMQTLYDSPVGYLIITAALLLIGASVLLARKIMNIKV